MKQYQFTATVILSIDRSDDKCNSVTAHWFCLGEIGIVILFNLIFIPLRGFCGGWHAGKSWLCTMTSAIVLLFSVFVGKDQLFQYGTNLWMILMGISCLTIWFLAPMDSEAKRLSDEEIVYYKKKVTEESCL